MAIKISIDKTVRAFYPENGKTFSIDELNDVVGGWVEPFKVGPVWVMSWEHAKEKKKDLNEIASYFFEVALHGEILVVPPQQLPPEWELIEDCEKFIPSEMVDSGFLLSLQNALMVKKMREENPGMNIDPLSVFESEFDLRPKEEYIYEPPTQIDQNTEDFLGQVYEYISKSPLQFSKGILLEDGQLIIRTNQVKRVLEMIKEICIEKEEYEKCAVIQKMEEKLP